MTRTKVAKVQVETVLHEDGSHVHTLTFTNGQKREVAFPADHALAAKFYAAGSKGKLLAAANSAAEADDAVKKVDALCDAFDQGKWGLIGEGGNKYSPLVLAFAEVKGVSEEVADDTVKGLTKSQQAKIRGTERIAAIIARIRAAEEGEGDTLLDNLLKDADENAGTSEA